VKIANIICGLLAMAGVLWFSVNLITGPSSPMSAHYLLPRPTIHGCRGQDIEWDLESHTCSEEALKALYGYTRIEISDYFKKVQTEVPKKEVQDRHPPNVPPDFRTWLRESSQRMAACENFREEVRQNIRRDFSNSNLDVGTQSIIMGAELAEEQHDPDCSYLLR
jgi:hypothetical protein